MTPSSILRSISLRPFTLGLFLLAFPAGLHAGNESLVSHSSFIALPGGISGNNPAATVTQSGPSSRSYNGFNNYSIIRLKAASGVNRLFVKAEAFQQLSPQEHSYASVSGVSIWQDLVTIHAPGRTGQSGSLSGSVRVDGSITTQQVVPFYNAANATVSVFYGFESETPLHPGSGRADGGRSVASVGAEAGSAFTAYSGHVLNFTIPFNYGTPFHLGVRVNGNATTSGSPIGSDGTSISTPGGTGTGSATIDFGNTVTWEGLTAVRDNAAQPVTNYTLTSLSGNDYRFPVREPAPVLPILDFADAGPGQKSLTWASTAGISYQLQTTTDPGNAAAWTNLGAPIPATSTATSTTFSFAPDLTPRFWRIREIPTP